MRYISFLLYKKLPQHQNNLMFQNTVMFKYDIFDFVYIRQVIKSLARTEILFQNNLNTFKIIML